MELIYIYIIMKKFKFKKHHNIGKLILFLFIILFFIIFIFLSFKKINKSYDNVIKYLLKDMIKEKRKIGIIKNLNLMVNRYEFQNNNLQVLNNKSLIYLYNTHDKEGYVDGTTIYDVTKLMGEKLKKLGIKNIVEDKKVSDYLLLGKKDYDISREFINDIKNKEDILYYIDIHRDSVKDTKVTINNKNYAKILFVLGMDNPNYLKNKDVLLKMNSYLNDNYPGLSKGILEKSGKDVDGVYNQDLDSNILLIEIGGIENNLEEVNNSTEIIALMLYSILGENK